MNRVPPNPINLYQLFAVTVHNGGLETGHYTAFVKCHGEVRILIFIF